MVQIKHGFQGQRMIILPFYLIDEMVQDPLMNDCFVHSLGFFPHAKYHYIDRPSGCPEHIFIYCSDGKGWFECYGKRYVVEENQFVILPPDVAHRYGASGDDPWTIYWFHFRGNKPPVLSNWLGMPFSITPEHNSRIEDRIRLFEEIYHVLDNSLEKESLRYANLSFLYFLGTILYLNTYRSSQANIKYGTSLVNLATHYMNENIERRLKLEDISTHFGYSSSYFYRLFFKSMGYAPMEYFNQLKIQRACYYLINTPRRVNEISLKLGFEDPYYFSRIFKKKMGVSPEMYRSNNRING